MEEIETRTIRKVMWRLMPFLVVCYFVAYLDRVNVGFAKLQMNAALGLSEAAYGFGAGLFFIAYFLLEVPSNLALDKFGARLWIARIMFSWGLISACSPSSSRSRTRPGSPMNMCSLSCASCSESPRRVLSRHHLLSDAVVPLGLSRPRRGDVHAGDPVLVDRRRAGLRRPPEYHRRRPRRLAVAVHLEALPSIAMAFVVVFYLTDRPGQAKCWPAMRRVARDAPRDRAQAEGRGRAP